MEVLVTNGHLVKSGTIIDHSNALATNRIRIYIDASGPQFNFKAGNSTYNVTGVAGKVGIRKFEMNWDGNSPVNGFIDGIKVGTPPATLANVTEQSILYIGSSNASTYQFNSIIRNVTISRPKRADADVSNRTLQSSPLVDKETRIS